MLFQSSTSVRVLSQLKPLHGIRSENFDLTFKELSRDPRRPGVLFFETELTSDFRAWQTWTAFFEFDRWAYWNPHGTNLRIAVSVVYNNDGTIDLFIDREESSHRVWAINEKRHVIDRHYYGQAHLIKSWVTEPATAEGATFSVDIG